MFEDFSERLFAHFVAGHWRAPFSEDAHSVTTDQGVGLGQVMAAGQPDIARALNVQRGADRQACRRLADTLERERDVLVRACALQNGLVPAAAGIDGLVAAFAAPTDAQGRVVFTTRATGLEDLGRALRTSIGGGAIWCPSVDQAVFATAFACLVQQADLPPGAFALLHAHVPSTKAAFNMVGLAMLEC